MLIVEVEVRQKRGWRERLMRGCRIPVVYTAIRTSSLEGLGIRLPDQLTLVSRLMALHCLACTRSLT